MKISHQAKLIIALVLWIPIGGFLGYFFLYEPLKFSYLIHRDLVIWCDLGSHLNPS